MFTIQHESQIEAPADEVWRRVSTLEGVNAELMPFVRMSAPPTLMRMSFAQVPLKQVLHKSWLLLFGFIPFDRHFIRLDQLLEHGFRENSYSWIHRVWRHERMITPNGTNAIVRDTLHIEPRIPLVHYALRPIIRLIFQHRHRQLQQHFSRG